jgi:predicted nuclease with TOPRIM domain
MFFLSMFKGMKIYLLLALAATITGGYFYIDRLKNNIDTLKINNSKYEVAITSKDAEIVRLNENVIEVRETNTRIRNKSAKLTGEVTALRDKLSKHDLGFLAENKPGLVESVINNAIKNDLKDGLIDIMESEK